MADDEVNPLGSPTTNYGWTKPAVGADVDAWGGMLNADLDGIDTTVKSVSTVANAAYPASNPSGYQTAAQVTASIAGKYDKTGGVLTGNISINAVGANIVGSALYASDGTTLLSQLYVNPANNLAVWTNTQAVCQINMNGDITVAPGTGHNLILSPGAGYQTGGGPWTALSDARIKTVDSEYAAGLDEVLALRPVVYRYKGNDSFTAGEPSMHAWATEKTFVGLVAQEAEIPFPEMVTQGVGFIDGEPVDDLRDLNTGPLIFALVNAVKTLAARVAELEAAR